MGDEYPRLGRSDGFLPVPGQSASSFEPYEGALNDLTPWQNREPFRGIGPLDDLDHPVAEAAQGALEFRAGLAAVREEVTQPGPAGADGAHDRWRSVAILDAGRVNHEPDQQAERVGDGEASNATGSREMPNALATLDPLAGVEAPNPAALGGFRAFASGLEPVAPTGSPIDDAGAPARLFVGKTVPRTVF